MGKVKKVFVFADKVEVLAELCAGAQKFGESIFAVVPGSKLSGECAIQLGANKAYVIKDDDCAMLEDCMDTIHELVVKHSPELILFGASKRSSHIVGRLAAHLGTSALPAVKTLDLEENAFVGKRLVYGGAAFRTEKVLGKTAIITVASGFFEVNVPDNTRTGDVEEVNMKEPAVKVKLIGKRSKEVPSVNLASAKRVVAVGRGIGKQEDLNMIYELASLMEAEIGCTRPITEGNNWLPTERYIGVSGVVVKPEVYFAVGLSGQIQHTVGCNQSRTIFAVNKDEAAPIFRQADYCMVGDLYKVIPAIIEGLR